ncbi:MAG TPA: hypothetical protein VF929_11355 [Gemmatimonadaceae bacterium]
MLSQPIRPALQPLAADPGAVTVRRLWKAMTPDERTAGITASLNDDPEGWVKTATRAAVATALRFRAQTVAQFPKSKLVSEAARLPIDDAQLLGGFLVDLHLGHRRPMMKAFLDALAIENDDGRIDSEKTQVPPQDDAAVAHAADALAARYPLDEVVTYFLTLLLQDAATWSGVQPWLAAHAE